MIKSSYNIEFRIQGNPTQSQLETILKEVLNGYNNHQPKDDDKNNYHLLSNVQPKDNYKGFYRIYKQYNHHLLSNTQPKPYLNSF